MAVLLADCLPGAAILHTDHALAAMDRADLVSTSRAAAGADVVARTGPADETSAEPRVLIIEGRHAFPSAVDAAFDVRVWMDVSPNTAAGWRIQQRIDEARRRGAQPPFGTWHAFPPDGAPVDDGYADVESVRPDGADVLFVPVSGMVPPIRIRFMAEAGCDFVLWDEENEYLGELEDLLPMPADLREAVKAWADRYYRFDGGALSLSAQQFEDLLADGERLSRQLQEALGPDYTVASSL
jgi:hypothetical protein